MKQMIKYIQLKNIHTQGENNELCDRNCLYLKQHYRENILYCDIYATKDWLKLNSDGMPYRCKECLEAEVVK